MTPKRIGKVNRETRETQIRLKLPLDGKGKAGYNPRSLS